VVVNRVRASAVGPSPESRIEQALERYAGVRSPFLVPDDREACDAVMLAGRNLTEQVPSSPARLAIGRVAMQLTGRPGKVRRPPRIERRRGA
jgi:hypothetical protein